MQFRAGDSSSGGRRRAAVHHWPGPGGGLSELQAEAAMRAFLFATGWDASDFELRIDPAASAARRSRPKDQLLTVRRRSNGQARHYYAGPFSAWLAQLLQDVEQGCFGTRRRV